MQAQKTIKIILISGRSGSGKTSVSHEMHARLSQLLVPHVSIEGDSLDEIYPEEDSPEIFLANLSSMWLNFTRLRGRTRLLMNGTALVLDADEIRKTIKQATGEVGDNEKTINVDMKAFVLCSSNDTAKLRLESRETDLTLQRHIESSSKMSKMLSKLEYNWLEFVNTDGCSVAGVTDQILEHCLHWYQSNTIE